MAEYRVDITRPAERELGNLEPTVGRRILESIESLALQPRPRQCRKLVASDNSYRLRVGRYRLVYQVDDANRIVRVVAVGHRRDIYR